MTVDAMRQTPTPSVRPRFAPFVAPGVVLAVVYSVLGTWSVGQGFGGESDDGGWVDFRGNPTSVPPPEVDVHGHPALWVYVVLAAILVGTAFWTARADGRRARLRAALGVVAATAFVATVVVVLTVVQMQLVQDAFARGDQHPPILSSTTTSVARTTSG